jgi:hypothetical protein
LSSRDLPSFNDKADGFGPFDGGSAAAGVLYQLGANVPPSAATRHGPTMCGPAIREVVQRSGRRPAFRRLGQDVEVLVVALDEIERRRRLEVLALVARDVADADPQRDVAVPTHDVLNGVECAVDVA